MGSEMCIRDSDIAIWASDNSLATACRKVEEAVERIFAWCREAKLTLNIDKCEVTFFSTDTHEAAVIPVVNVQGRNLPFNPTPRFLGVTFDRSLTFRQHIDQICRTAIQRCRLIGTLANREWGWHPKRLRAIYLALVRSVLSFAAAGWVPWISADAMNQLVRADNRALCIVSGLLNTAPVETIAIEAGVQDLKTHYDYLIGKSWISAQCLPQQHPRSLAYRGNVALRTRREDWSTRGRDVCNLHKIGKLEDRLSSIGSPPDYSTIRRMWRSAEI